MMFKQVQFFGKTASGIHCAPLFGSSGAFEKTAGAPAFADWQNGDELRRYISKISKQDREQNAYVLVNALGAGEYFGSNINADYFPWNALAHEGDDYGYKTFLKAHAFQHHVNKDPTRAFGVPVLSLLNTQMKRVELVVKLNREKAKVEGADGIIVRIDKGEFPDVSMGCFPAGTSITMADGTRRPIELIQVGDEVLTHKGRVRKVTELHRRHYSGPLHSIKAEAHPTLRSTKQHPFYTVPQSQVKEKDDHSNLRWMVERELQPDWVDAESLGLDSYLLEPVPTEELQPTVYESLIEPRHNAFARLLGYYLAEGHLLRNKKKELVGIELTTHKDDPVHDEIEDLCTRFGTSNPPSTHERVNSENSVGIYIFDKELAELCSKHAGSYSELKKLSREVMFWPKGLQFEMLGAYANGDGCGPSDGSLKFSTASQDLSWQVYLLLLRNGFVPSHSVLNHGATGLSTRPTTEYVVHIGKQQTPHFVRVCAKVKPSEVLKAKNSRVFALEKGLKDVFVVTPIREMTAFHVEMEVFNFEVEEDNSYVAEGLAVHNCKVPFDVCYVCGHRSKTKDDYCVHMKPPEDLRHLYGPNKILPDGKRCCVINTVPRFFDISFVFIGADKTAKVMAKLASRGNQICLGDICSLSKPQLSTEIAEQTRGEEQVEELSKVASVSEPDCSCGCGTCGDSEKVAGTKLGEITKSVPAGTFALKALPKLETDEITISRSALDEMAEHDLGSSCSTSALMGIVLKPQEFQRLVLVRMGEVDLADDLEARKLVFRQSESFDNSLSIDKEKFNPLIKDLLSSLVGSRSGFGVPLQMRVIRISTSPKKTLPTESSIDHPLLDKVAAAYNGYRRSVIEKLSQAEEVIMNDPKLREEVTGDSLVNMFTKTAGTSILSPDSLSYFSGVHLQNRNLLSDTLVDARVF